MCETTCDHLMGFSYDSEGYYPIYASDDMPLIAGDRVEWFTFCPMCGLPLQKREAVPA